VGSLVEHLEPVVLKVWDWAGPPRASRARGECVDYQHRNSAMLRVTMLQLLWTHSTRLTAKGAGRKDFVITPTDPWHCLRVYLGFPDCFPEAGRVLREEPAALAASAAV
jgi:hypothetical protein